MRKKKWIPLAFLIYILQIVLEAAVFLKADSLHVIPDDYLLLFGVILIVALLITALLLFSGIGKGPSLGRSIRRVIAVILVVIIGCVSVLGMSYLDKADDTLTTVTATKPVEYTQYGVYVLQDSEAEDITDLAAANFAISREGDEEAYEKVLQRINTAVSEEIRTEDYESPVLAVRALYNQDVDALIMKEAFAGILEDTEEFGDFDSAARLVYEVSLQKETETQNSDGSSEEEGEAAAENIPLVAAQEVSGGVPQIDPFILYISGSDTRSQVLETSNSDVNILAAVNPQTKQILLLNTPRDYFIPNPAGDGALDKLTHLGIYGMQNSMKGLGDLYGVDIHYFVEINFTGFETLIDAIGGITVNSDVAFSTGNYEFVEGPNEMDGAKALAFARDRHHQATGDNARGRHQMMVIEAVIQKLTSGTVLLLHFNEIMNSLSGMFQTNLTSDDITALVKMQLSDRASWDIRRYAVTGQGGSDYNYSLRSMKVYVMYEDEEMVAHASELLKKVMDGEVLTDSDLED